MEFIQEVEPDIDKPIIIAAMQDMGNVGSIVVDFINEKLQTKPFRLVKSSHPSYVLDRGGYIDIPEETWEYRYSDDLIVFGGGSGQPQSNDEIHSLCQDVIDIAKKYSAKFIYTLGGFHTKREIQKNPKTYATSTSQQLTKQLEKIELDFTPQESIITGFNGIILGYAKINGIQGIGLYGELNEPSIPQYRTARGIINTLEKLTYQNFGDKTELEEMAIDVEKKIHKSHSFEFKQ